jgi:flagellar motor switch/type III secretory pathway protein FliN
MIHEPARAWLPAGALDLARIQRLYEGRLAAWSSLWFVGSTARLSDMRGEEPDAGAEGHGPGVKLSLSPKGRRVLFEAACAVNLAELELSDADRVLVDAFTDKMATHLLEAMDLAGDDAAANDHRWRKLNIRVTEKDALALYVSEALLVQHLKANIERPRRRLAPISARSAAVAKSNVSLEGVLGHGSIPMGDFETLAQGDVIVLDERIEDGATLILAQTGRRLGRGALGRDQDLPTIQLQRISENS